MFFKKYIFGDTAVYYVESPVEGHDGKTTIGLALYPAQITVDEKKLFCDSLVQVAFTGDEALIDYTEGVTMRNHSSTVLKIERQTSDMGGVRTVLSDEKGNFYTHNLRYDEETGVFCIFVEYENRSKEARTLERLDSFSISGIAALSKGLKTTAGLRLHRMTSAWSRECRMKTDAFSTLGLDMSWGRYGVKVEQWGQLGLMPNRGYFPFGAIEDEGVVWGVMLEAPFSWQLEVYQEKETCALSGGLSDYDRGHWRKTIGAGERFSTHAAYVTVKESVNAVCNAIVHYQDNRLTVPSSEEELPVMYNEYCATWGNPTEPLMLEMIDALKEFPEVKYFVIDSGWYKPEDRGWCNAIGDWNINRTIFPDLSRISARAKAAGMKAGIWYEFEVAGRDSDTFWKEEMLLSRDGAPLTTKNRRFLDLRKKEVVSFLEEKLLRQLKDNGFEYLKIDYNDTYGVGCDSSDGAALGEGGRQLAEESLAWLNRLKERVPEIVIENCSSGGSRIEPKRMNMVSMCSFSDAHECPEIPLVAANVSRVIPARQSQIWAVLRTGESDARTIYSLSAAMMGRICLSGDILGLSSEKKGLVKEGLAFYESVKEIVRRGDIVKIDCDVEYYRIPRGRQIYVKEYRDSRLVIVHSLEFTGDVTLPLDGYGLARAFTDMPYEISENVVRVSCSPYHAGAFLLKK